MTISNFIPSVTGMNSMSAALESVAENISNMNTTGYKQRQTLFKTLLGSAEMGINNQSGLSSSRVSINGVSSFDRYLVELDGTVKNTGNTYNVAISGNTNAFFKLNDGYGNYYFTRAGDFSKNDINGNSYLVSSGGLFVQGFAAIDGKNEFSNTISDIVINAPFALKQIATTEASINANLPAREIDQAMYSINIYSDSYDGKNLNVGFKKQEGAINTWDLTFNIENGTVVSNQNMVVFNTDGTIKTPKNMTLTINWDDGTTSNVELDISQMTQMGTSSQVTKIYQNGFPSGTLEGIGFNENGILRAIYSNSNEHIIAKLAVSGFTAPENLIPANTTLFEASGEVGEERYVDLQDLIVPESVETSNVNIEQEFTKMISVQRAYSLNSQSFTVNDEMLSLLVDLKS